MFLAVTAIAATGIVIAQRIANQRAGELADAAGRLVLAKDAQLKSELAAKDAQLQADLKAKDVEIAKALSVAAEANGVAAEAQVRAAEANKAAAEANEKAQKEQLARVKIEQAMAHRRLLPPAQSAVAAKLRAFAGQRISKMMLRRA